MVNYTESVTDGSERLKLLLLKRHFVHVDQVTDVMNGLNDISLVRLQAAIERAETSKLASETLLEVLKNVKKLKESQQTLQQKDEVAVVKEQQKERHKAELNARANLPLWNLPQCTDDDMDL